MGYRRAKGCNWKEICSKIEKKMNTTNRNINALIKKFNLFKE